MPDTDLPDLTASNTSSRPQSNSNSSNKHSMFAIFRTHPDKELSEISDRHMKKDLTQADRDRLKSAANKVSNHTLLGSLLGLGLGLVAATRIRANRLRLYEAFRLSGITRPTEVIFENGVRGSWIPPLFLHPLFIDSRSIPSFGMSDYGWMLMR